MRFAPAGDEPVEALANDGPREFEIAVLDRPIGEARLEFFRERGELGDSVCVAAPVAADHDRELLRHARHGEAETAATGERSFTGRTSVRMREARPRRNAARL